MNGEERGKCEVFFDRDAFERIAENAKEKRASFGRRNPRFVLVLLGAMVLISGTGLLVSSPSRDTNIPDKYSASAEYFSEAQVNAATDEIERIKSALERVSAVPPDIVNAIEQEIRQPAYDCNQMPCSAPLQHRNYAARSQLTALLARKAVPEQSRGASADRLR